MGNKWILAPVQKRHCECSNTAPRLSQQPVTQHHTTRKNILPASAHLQSQTASQHTTDVMEELLSGLNIFPYPPTSFCIGEWGRFNAPFSQACKTTACGWLLRTAIRRTSCTQITKSGSAFVRGVSNTFTWNWQIGCWMIWSNRVYRLLTSVLPANPWFYCHTTHKTFTGLKNALWLWHNSSFSFSPAAWWLKSRNSATSVCCESALREHCLRQRASFSQGWHFKHGSLKHAK